MIKYIDELQMAEKRVFVRADFNVPLEGGRVTDDSRIEVTLPTINYLVGQGARLVLASHLGRPKGKKDPKYSLLPVAECLVEKLGSEVMFPDDCDLDAVAKLSKDLKKGGVILLENLRFDPGEEANDPVLSKKLASLAEVYISEAFGSLHRVHASTSGMVSHFSSKAAGFLIRRELSMLSKIAENPERPFWAIIGGAKVADKIGLIERLVDKVDGLVLGGALAYTFLKAKGDEVGRSKVEEEKIHLARRILKKAERIELRLPVDHKVARSTEPGAEGTITDSADIPKDMIGLDIGPKTIDEFCAALGKARTIFWNGPLGYFELPEFAVGTESVARVVAKSGAISVVGGGDSLAAIKKLGLEGKITHLSTGGGASLTYLEGRKLPGLAALEG